MEKQGYEYFDETGKFQRLDPILHPPITLPWLGLAAVAFTLISSQGSILEGKIHEIFKIMQISWKLHASIQNSMTSTKMLLPGLFFKFEKSDLPTSVNISITLHDPPSNVYTNANCDHCLVGTAVYTTREVVPWDFFQKLGENFSSLTYYLQMAFIK